MAKTDEELINSLFKEDTEDEIESSDSQQFMNKDINKVSLFDFVENNCIDLKSPSVYDFFKNTGLTTDFQLEMFYHTKNLQSEEESVIRRSMKKTNRYFGDTRVCFNCLQRGHTNQNCEYKANKCSLCSSRDHLKNDCPMTVCMKCYRLGHRYTDCIDAKKDRFFKCYTCECLHLSRDCPVWRVYKTDKLNKKKRRNITCALCQSKNHLAEDCDGKYYIGVFNKHFMSLSRFDKHT